MEPTKLLFGTKTTVLQRDDESSKTITERTSNANVVQHYVRVRESIKIQAEPEVLREFIALLDLIKDNKRYYDPAFEMVIDQKTGKIVLVYKSFSERKL